MDIAEEQLLASVGGNNHAAPFMFIGGEFVGEFNDLYEKLSEDPRRYFGAWGRGMAAVQLAVVQKLCASCALCSSHNANAQAG